ncbi:Crp/Fnr family transcriptional regulator [Microvirga makkahensis]|uniref:Helix-turn-helix domain-containing protein n=1 Tax=Microvirga makkahensis TaxID=1128670 RepID=A0A7X3MSM3_9HYPH|nr:Crp/Fnr family transcriptional regulator [Microvirga makkahensis]MXQ12406.1 helix-turn-helix domain-containing protein [Microvirga makkahensis]
MPQSLIRKLEHIAPLSSEEKQVLIEAVARTRDLRPDEDLIREGEQPTDCHVILEGMLCRYKLLREGKRQITGFQIAGDLVDLCGLLMGRMDHSVGTLTPAKVGVIPHQILRRIMEGHPRLAQALWQETLIDASITREWVANLGRRAAYQRLAHLLCEMGVRLNAVGRRTDGASFEWLMTQSEVADAMGLSTVHVNRILQQLRAEGLIVTQGNEIRVLDWDRLQQAGEFSPDYLFLGPNLGDGERRQPII